MSSIPISELNTVGVVSGSDYIPVVQNSSVTTFKTTFAVVGNWISSSVQASSSVASVSASSAISSSYAQVGGSSSYASNLIYPNTSTASYSISSSHANQSDNSISASHAISASWAPVQGSTAVSISSSWASASLFTLTSSFASGSKTSVSSSWASASLSSSNSVTSSFSLVTITSSFAQTASYVLNPQTNFEYPYLQSLQFWCRNDDWVDFNFLGANWQSPGNGMCMGFVNSGGTPTLKTLQYDNTNKVYNGTATSTVNYTPIITSPAKFVRMWVDNRGGGPHNFIFFSDITASFALSPTQTVTHVYTANAPSMNWAGNIFFISADRAAAGLNSIIFEYSTTTMFPFTIL